MCNTFQRRPHLSSVAYNKMSLYVTHLLCPEMRAMANLAILSKSCHTIDNPGGFGNCDEFGEILSNYQTYVNI